MNSPRPEFQRHALDYWQTIRNRLGIIVVSFLGIFCLAAIITYITPRKYRGHVELVIERNQDDVRVEGHQPEAISTLTDVFLKTQFETITKRKTLNRVLEKLNLGKRWDLKDPAQAAAKLYGNLDAQTSLKSDFITLDYYDEDPRLAADIANAVAESYGETRLELDGERSQSAISQLTVQIDSKEKSAELALSSMLAIKKRLGIVEMPNFSDHRNVGADVLNSPDNATLVDGARDVYKIQKDCRDMKAQSQQLEKLEGDDLIRQAGELHVEDDTIRKLLPTYQELLLKREQLRNTGIGGRHPTMQSVEAQIAETRKLLLSAAEDYRKNLVVRAQISVQQLMEMEGLNQQQRDKSLSDQVGSQEYLRARKDWEIQEVELAKLKDTKAQKEIDLHMSKTPVTIYQKAEPENRPRKPNVLLNLSLGAVVGLLFGFGVAFFLEYLDTSLKTIDEVETFMGVPVLGVIPRGIQLVWTAVGNKPDAEAYRILRTNIEFNRPKPDANCLTVVSGTAGEGKSTTMVNLATVCAQGGYTTLLIDADMRRHSLNAKFERTNANGLSTYLSTDIPVQNTVLQTPVANLYFMPSGPTPADPAGLLNSKKFSDFIKEMKARFDIVLLDAPPILGVSDAAVLAAEADMALIVMEHRKLPRKVLSHVKHAVDQVGGTVIGVVLNNVDLSTDSAFSYRTSYYAYYHTEVGGTGVKAKKTQKGQPRQPGLIGPGQNEPVVGELY